MNEDAIGTLVFCYVMVGFVSGFIALHTDKSSGSCLVIAVLWPLVLTILIVRNGVAVVWRAARGEEL